MTFMPSCGRWIGQPMEATSGRTEILQASPERRRLSAGNESLRSGSERVMNPPASSTSFTLPGIRLFMPMKSATKGFCGRS